MRRGGKAMKYMRLEEFRESIIEMMQHDIALPLVLRWLKNEHEVVMVPNTLRKFITKRIGRDSYNEYLQRNGWLKAKRGVAVPQKGGLDEHTGRRSTDAERTSESVRKLELKQVATPQSDLTVAEMKEGLRTSKIDPADFD